MKILICVFYNAQLGGLQANILSTALHCQAKGHEVTVLCKEGLFNDQLIRNGIATINTDYADPTETAQRLLSNGLAKFDVIHTHPFMSRKVAMILAKATNTPLLITYHGMYADELAASIGQYSAVLAVSDGIREYLSRTVPNDRSKIFVAPNGVNLHRFDPAVERQAAMNDDEVRSSRPVRIGLATRLDKDKQFIIDMFYKALRYSITAHPHQIVWNIIGDGTLKDEVRQTCDGINSPALTQIDMKGWLEGEELHQAYLECDVIIAPGRCALESMACAKPTIAIGSKGYVGLIDSMGWMKGLYTNFGGLGDRMNDYTEGSIERDLATVLSDARTRQRLGQLGRLIVERFYDDEAINDRILALYELSTL